MLQGKHTELEREQISIMTKLAMARPDVQQKIKGRKLSEDHIQKLREAKKRFYENGGVSNFKGKHFVGTKNGFFGKHHSDETKEHWSETRRGRVLSEETKEKLKEYNGEKASNWQGGITPENKKIRNGVEFRLWREAVFARDNWTCQKTGIKSGKLVAHHIKNFAQYPELRFAIDNGITLSKDSHTEFHKNYGKINNIKEQIIKFLGETL